MSSSRLLFCCLVMTIMALSLSAQDPRAVVNANLPKLSNVAFGWVSMSGVDPTLDALASFAPTMITLRDHGLMVGSETATGTFTFGSFAVNSHWESANATLGPGTIRAVHYGFSSNRAPIPALSMLPPAQTSGDSVELSYAQRIGSTSVGISFIPQDSTSISFVDPTTNTEVIAGSTKTDFGIRVGAVTPVKSAKFGADFSYQKDHSTLSAILPVIGPYSDSGNYITRCGTIGFSVPPTPRTMLFGAYQKIWASGSSSLGPLRREADLNWFGLQYDVTKTLAVRVCNLGGGTNYGLRWLTPIGIVNAAYTDRALTGANDMLGSGHAAFIGLDIAH